VKPFAFIVFDGERLSDDPRAEGRRLRIDARCLAGEPAPKAFANVCALANPDAALRFDEPEVQQVRRDALAWWIPLLGDSLVCLTTIALDASRYAGAITVARDPALFRDDPFARLFPATTVTSDLFSPVAPPPGPVFERYAGAPVARWELLGLGRRAAPRRDEQSRADRAAEVAKLGRQHRGRAVRHEQVGLHCIGDPAHVGPAQARAEPAADHHGLHVEQVHGRGDPGA